MGSHSAWAVCGRSLRSSSPRSLQVIESGEFEPSSAITIVKRNPTFGHVGIATSHTAVVRNKNKRGAAIGPRPDSTPNRGIAPTMQKITVFQVAEVAGVSIKTVSRVINREPNVRPSTRDRVNQVIAELDYRPDEAARNLARLRSRWSR